jgi:peroxiredoxin
MSDWLRPLAIAAVVAGLAPGCDATQRPNRPIAPFAADGLDGTQWDGQALRGRPWVINVWMPGCKACLEEFSALEKTRSAFERQGVGFLAISIDQDVRRVREVARRLGLSMPVAIARGDVLKPFGMRAIPSTAFVSAEGKVVALAKGSQRRAYFEARARELLGQR